MPAGNFFDNHKLGSWSIDKLWMTTGTGSYWWPEGDRLTAAEAELKRLQERLNEVEAAHHNRLYDLEKLRIEPGRHDDDARSADAMARRLHRLEQSVFPPKYVTGLLACPDCGLHFDTQGHKLRHYATCGAVAAPKPPGRLRRYKEWAVTAAAAAGCLGFGYLAYQVWALL